MRIGELAARAEVNPKTIRFYEQRGLLPDPARLPSGYRDYGAEDERRLGFIKSAQRLGLSLAEIGEILAFKERGERPCNYVLSVLQAQLVDIDRRIGELVRLRADLANLEDRADQLPADSGCYCGIVEHAGQAPPAALRGPLTPGTVREGGGG